MQGETSLRNPFVADVGVVVEPHSGVECNEPAYILTKVYIPGYVVERLVDQFLSGVGGR